MFDLDKSNSIDKAEGILFWGKNFSKLNTEVMFEYIDRNGDNILQYEEWIDFWNSVKRQGYSDLEIEEEVF